MEELILLQESPHQISPGILHRRMHLQLLRAKQNQFLHRFSFPVALYLVGLLKPCISTF